MMLTIGIAIAGSVFAFISQVSEMRVQINMNEKHIDQLHPPEDYRALIEHDLETLQRRLDRLERRNEKP